jgi:hypothetical protein
MHVIIYAGTDPDLPKDGWGSYYIYWLSHGDPKYGKNIPKLKKNPDNGLELVDMRIISFKIGAGIRHLSSLSNVH